MDGTDLSDRGDMGNAARRLHDAGQSLWLDSISRRLLQSGDLMRYISQLDVTGLTSNPTILGHAMAASSDYDESLRRHVSDGVRDAEDLVYAAALEDLTAAADMFLPAWLATGGADGYVSLEVPPGLSDDVERSMAYARRLHREANRPNLLVKIPGTRAGLTALEELVAEGIGVNVTLLFSEAHYVRTAEAYMRGLERRAAAGLSLDVPSVASLFVSRWDVAADPLLPPALHAKLGLAVTQLVYAAYCSLVSSARWAALAFAGARPQRLLWASTATKDPTFPDTYYLGRLAAPNTINTVPVKTLLAFADHGVVGEMMQPDGDSARQQISEIVHHGVDVLALGDSLQRQGARAFEADWSTLLGAITSKVAGLTAA